MKKFFLTNILFLLYTALFAQTSTITGRVQLQDGTAVATATVQVEGTQIASYSDDECFNKLEVVLYDKHIYLVSSIEVKQKLTPLEINKPKYDLIIFLDPSGDIKLDEVQIVRNTVNRE